VGRRRGRGGRDLLRACPERDRDDFEGHDQSRDAVPRLRHGPDQKLAAALVGNPC